MGVNSIPPLRFEAQWHGLGADAGQSVQAPLDEVNEKELCPGSAAPEKINASLR